MQQLGQYVVTLTTASLVSGILLSLFREGTVRSMLRIICGVFLTITVLSPLTNYTIPDFSVWMSDYLPEGKYAAAMGEKMASIETLERIEDELEAYILDKAGLMGYQITAEVSVSREGIPEFVHLTGMVSDTVKRDIQEMIAHDLGISKENQQWTGEK